MVLDEVFVTEEKQEFNTSATVTEYTNETEAGILTEESLEFGRVSQGTGLAKFMNFSASEPIMVSFDSSGNISEKLQYPNDVYFQGSNRIEIGFISEEPGYFEGKLEIKVSSSDSGIGKSWIKLKSQVLGNLNTIRSTL